MHFKLFNVAFVLAVTLFKYNTKFSTYSAVCRFFNSLFNLKMLLHVGVVTELSLAYLISKYIRLFFSCSSIALKKDVTLFSTAKAIFEKIDFRVMDSTNHNFHVDEKVSDHLDSAHVPKELICHVHPVFRMVRDMIKTLCAV